MALTAATESVACTTTFISALSQLDFRVEGLELAACVFDYHLPVDAALGRVDVGRSGGQFGQELD